MGIALPAVEFGRDGYTVSTDPARLDLRAVHDYLTNDSYWSRGIPFPVFHKSAENSLCFGVYQGERQVGFARAISDFATFAYLADVFILEEQRGRGLGKWLVECILSHPALQGLRRWMLVTQDAHGLYAQYGFQPLANPERIMEIVDPEIYRR